MAPDRSLVGATADGFDATLSPEQRKLYLDLIEVQSDLRLAEHDVWEDEIIRHAPPGWAMMLGLLFDHLRIQRIDQQGVCCPETEADHA